MQTKTNKATGKQHKSGRPRLTRARRTAQEHPRIADAPAVLTEQDDAVLTQRADALPQEKDDPDERDAIVLPEQDSAMLAEHEGEPLEEHVDTAMAPRAGPKGTTLKLREPSDSLAAFVRDVGRVAVLDAAGEQRIAREIEAREIAVWEQILLYSPALALVLDVLGKTLGQATPDLEPLRRAAAAVARSADEASVTELAEAARHIAEQVRELDREHHALDAVVAVIERSERGEDERPVGVTQEQLAAYGERIRAAVRHAAEPRNAFVEANLRLVFMIASQYASFGVPLADLIQEGNLGLMTAVNRFDYRRGLRFSTYAGWWIRHMVGRAVANKSRMVRVPVYLLEGRQRMERIRRELSAQLGRVPTDEEVTEATRATGYSESRIEAIRAMGSGYDMSLDQPMDEEDDTARQDVFRDPRSDTKTPADALVARHQMANLESAFDKLTKQEADILRKRFALDDDREWTLREIAQEYGVSRERIRQVQNRALLKLRKELDASDEAPAML